MTHKYWSPKFGHDPVCEALWLLSLDGWQSEEAGTVEDIGWFALMHFEQPEIVPGVLPGGGTVTVPSGTYILETNDQGFVGYTSHPYLSADEDWQKILDAEAKVYAEHEEEED